MNSSDEEDFLILLLLRRRRKRKRQIILCREHFLLRESRGEFHRTFRHLLENPDELFFNYTRMSFRTYNALKSLVLERMKPGHSNWRKSIAAEEKLIVTLRCLATGASFSSMSVPFHMSRRSITRHVYQTCQVLWDVLQPLELKPPTEDQWFQMA